MWIVKVDVTVAADAAPGKIKASVAPAAARARMSGRCGFRKTGFPFGSLTPWSTGALS
jgi:hypothetical protein